MNAYFLCNKTCDYLWCDFIDTLNKKRSYVECFKTDSLYDYFLNLTFALINDKSLILIDSDINDAEIEDLGLDNINTEKQIAVSNEVKTISDLVSLINNSTSKITIFTSGTTGLPKKVTHTVASFTRSVRISQYSSSAIWGFAYNPTHMAGLQVFFQSLLNGATLVDIFTMSSERVFEAIDKYNITHISATPTFYRLLLPSSKTLSSVVRITLGGEKSSPKLHQQIQSVFPNAKINNIYALTEAGALFSSRGNVFTIPENIKHQVRIVDDEILLHKDLLGDGISLQLINDYYSTGDIIVWINQSKGEFEFINRKNELINVGGYKVNPHEVELQILNIEGVANCLVYSKLNSVLGNIVCCDVKLVNGSSVTEVEIKEYLSQNLQSFKVPRIIKFVEELKTTKTGKIIRK